VTGGFRHSLGAQHPDLRSTYEAVKTLNILNLWESIVSEKGKDIRPDIAQFVATHKVVGSGYAEAPGQEADVISTSLAVSILSGLGSKNTVQIPTDELAAFVVSLQAADGGWKLRKANSGSGHYVNTFYALEALEALGKTSLLEPSFRKEGVLVYHYPQYLPTIAVYVVVALALVTLALLLYIAPGKSEEPTNDTVDSSESEAEAADTTSQKDDSEGKKPKSKTPGAAKKKKKEATVTVIRNNETKECVDKDGVAFSVETLDKTTWDIVSQENKGTHTVYVIRKKEVQTSPQIRGRKRK